MVEPVSSLTNYDIKSAQLTENPSMPAITVAMNGNLPTNPQTTSTPTEYPHHPSTVKIDPEVRNAVIRQIEWYLGRENLARDFYLRQRMDPGLWAPLEVILRFPKMQKLGVMDDKVVAALLKEGSDQVEVDPQGLFVRPLWAGPATAAAAPSPVPRASNMEGTSTLLLRNVPPAVSADIVIQAFKDIPKCPTPTTAQPESNGGYAVIFNTPDGAQHALEIAQGSMIAGMYPIEGQIRIDAQGQPSTVLPMPPSPGSPFTPQTMVPPLQFNPYQVPPSPGFGNYAQSPRGFFSQGGMYGNVSNVYGVEQPLTPGGPPMTPTTPNAPIINQMPNPTSAPMPMAGVNGHAPFMRPSNGPSMGPAPNVPMHIHAPGYGGGMRGPNRHPGRNWRATNGGYGNPPPEHAHGQTFNGAYDPMSEGARTSGSPHKGGPVRLQRGERSLRMDGSTGGMGDGRKVGGIPGPYGEKRRGKGRRRRDETRTDLGKGVVPDGKKGNEMSKEAQISTMYFPPLPGANEPTTGDSSARKEDGDMHKRWSGQGVPGLSGDGANVEAEISGPLSENGGTEDQDQKVGGGEEIHADVVESVSDPSEAVATSEVDKSPAPEVRKRDSLTGGMSYAAILQSKRRSGSSPPAAAPSTTSQSHKKASESEQTLPESDGEKKISQPPSRATSPRSSSNALTDGGSSDTEKKGLLKAPSPPSKEQETSGTSGDEALQNSLSKAGSTIDSAVQSDNDTQSMASNTPENTEPRNSSSNNASPPPVESSPSEKSDRSSSTPSNSVWANKPKAVLEAAPITPSPKVTAQKTAQRNASKAAPKGNSNGAQKGGSKTSSKAVKGMGPKREKREGVRSNSVHPKQGSKGRSKKSGNGSDRPQTKATRVGSDPVEGTARKNDNANANGGAAKAKPAITAKGAWASGGPKSLAREDKTLSDKGGVEKESTATEGTGNKS